MQPNPNPTPSSKGAKDPRTLALLAGLLLAVGIAAYLFAG
jgi:hypothetical protein